MSALLETKSPLEEERLKAEVLLPPLLEEISQLHFVEEKEEGCQASEEIASLFPNTYRLPSYRLAKGKKREKASSPLRVGVLFSGGQAPGGHNVVVALFDVLKEVHPESLLFGFLNGADGLLKKEYKELTFPLLEGYRNSGGFDLLGSGRTKIEDESQFEKVVAHVKELKLDGLVIIGGDDSNTNAAFLTEYFLKKGVSTSVIGIPKTIDGDLRCPVVELSFGFDTACRVYSEMIGNIARDALSARKYYHFIRLMGRSASHITLECALMTHPNAALIGEEIAAGKKSLAEISASLADLVIEREKKGKSYGVILIPEGLVEFIPEIRSLIKEWNTLLAKKISEDEVEHALSSQGRETYAYLPGRIRNQLLKERDPHGNILLSQVATEELLILTVKEELKKRGYRGKFSPVPHFLGYEGRAAFPSPFDTTYAYVLGMIGALLIREKKTGYLCGVTSLEASLSSWAFWGTPLTSLLHFEERKGKKMAVIAKALVDLEGGAFKAFQSHREKWAHEECYRYPGPLQFAHPPQPPLSLLLS